MAPLRMFRMAAAAASVTLAAASSAMAASPIQQLTRGPAAELRPAWSPDGGRIAFQSNRSGGYEVYVIDADGSNERRISTGSNGDRHPAWSPDGRLIAVDSGSDTAREIWTLDVQTGARVQITSIGAQAGFPAFSPDGKTISFYLYRAGVLDLWTAAADGSSAKPLVPSVASENRKECAFACHAPSWSPDGSRVAYSQAGLSQVWTIRVSDGGDARRVSPDPDTGASRFPVYLADGRLLYVTERLTPGLSWTDVWMLAPNATGAATLYLDAVQVQGPFEFSADGQQLLFASPRGGSFDLYRVALTTEGKAALSVKSAEADLAPALEAALQADRAAAPVPTPGGADPAPRAAPVAVAPVARAPAAATSASSGAGGLPGPAVPFLAALVGVAGVWLTVELATRYRRRRRMMHEQ